MTTQSPLTTRASRPGAQPLTAQPLPAQPLTAQPLPAQPLPAQPLPARRLARRATGAGDELSAILSLAGAGDTITFSGGFPAPETFPTGVLSQLAAEAVGPDAATALQYTPTEGLASLRDTLRGWLERSQGRAPDSGEVMVTSGGIEALSLLARCLVDPGDPVLVEAPTYLGAITAFTGFEAQVEAVDTDEEGLSPAALERRLATGRRPALLYVIPDFQNPTGRWTSAGRRQEIVEVCRRHGVLLVEDVAYRELAFTPEDRPSMWSLGPDIVVQVGTFSKIFFPGVRLGWAAGPADLIAALVRTKQNSDQCAGGLGQRMVEGYLAGGHLERQLVRSRALYAERATALLAALERHLPAGSSWTRPQGGFFTWVSAPAGVDTAALLPRAAELRVAYVPGAPFYPDRSVHHQIRLSFSRVTPEEIEEGTRRLGALLQQAAEERR